MKRELVSRAELRSDRHSHFWGVTWSGACGRHAECIQFIFNWDSLYEIHKLDGSLVSVHVAAAGVRATVRCLHWAACLTKKHCKVGTARGTPVLVAVSSQKKWVWLLTRFASRKWRSRLNRISHPDWVKLSVEINWAPNQNTRFSSSLHWEKILTLYDIEKLKLS